jgi:PelA/Pel-15E family pectate lyase
MSGWRRATGRSLLAVWGIAALSGWAAIALDRSIAAQSTPSVWASEIVRREPEWYALPQARQIADSLIQYQSPQGGWPKNTDLAVPPKAGAIPSPTDSVSNTFDNDGTTLPMEFLARVIHASGDGPYRRAFDRGLEYTLAAQYPNGGWPQFYPLRAGYYSHVTLNDDAMIRVMSLLRDVAAGEPPFGFVDRARRERAAQAVSRGVELILRIQIRQSGQLTGWCAQYDERTLEPAWARSYEPPSISGNESVGVIRFLMGIQRPSPQVVAAVDGGVRWLRASAITGMRVERFSNRDGQPDTRVVADTSAEPLWARFYELGSNRPIFLGRDGVVRYVFAEIEYERRNGYNYYGSWARTLLEREYPAWRARQQP